MTPGGDADSPVQHPPSTTTRDQAGGFGGRIPSTSSRRTLPDHGPGAGPGPMSKVAYYCSLLVTFVVTFFSRFKSQARIRLNNRNLIVLRSLGEGGFAFVSLVKDASTSELMALKRARIQLPEHEQRIKKEIEAHGKVRSNHVVPLIDSALVRGSNGMQEGLLLLPYFERGTVQDVIDRKGPLPLAAALRYTIHVCEGLAAFHSCNPPLAFRDLKPANILISSPDNLGVLTDLGSVAPARVSLTNRQDALALQEECAETVTAPYRAPELFDTPSQGFLTEQSDIWGLGCTIYAMLYGESPFDGSLTAAMSGQIPFPNKDSYPSAIREIISDCLRTDWTKRPSAQGVAERCRILSDASGQV
ncbi:kinase-like domain-containing protein [Phlyctochytrium arcticum]|nr:kinase-like domain-containing protein [Phlyctochytrium arcticum]